MSQRSSPGNEDEQMFGKKKEKRWYDPDVKRPMIKASICNGEQVAGFKNLQTGAFEEIMLIRYETDLESFKKEYGISGEITKIY